MLGVSLYIVELLLFRPVEDFFFILSGLNLSRAFNSPLFYVRLLSLYSRIITLKALRIASVDVAGGSVHRTFFPFLFVVLFYARHSGETKENNKIKRKMGAFVVPDSKLMLNNKRHKLQYFLLFFNASVILSLCAPNLLLFE